MAEITKLDHSNRAYVDSIGKPISLETYCENLKRDLSQEKSRSDYLISAIEFLLNDRGNFILFLFKFNLIY